MYFILYVQINISKLVTIIAVKSHLNFRSVHIINIVLSNMYTVPNIILFLNSNPYGCLKSPNPYGAYSPPCYFQRIQLVHSSNESSR